MAGLARENKTLTENASNEMHLTPSTLGYDPGGSQCQHSIEVTNLGGRTWALQVMGPSGTFTAIASGMTTAIFCFGPVFTGVLGAAELPIRFRARELRIVLSGAGAGAIGHVQSEMVGI